MKKESISKENIEKFLKFIKINEEKKEKESKEGFDERNNEEAKKRNG